MSWVPAGDLPLGGLPASGWGEDEFPREPDVPARQAFSRRPSDFSLHARCLGGWASSGSKRSPSAPPAGSGEPTRAGRGPGGRGTICYTRHPGPGALPAPLGVHGRGRGKQGREGKNRSQTAASAGRRPSPPDGKRRACGSFQTPRLEREAGRGLTAPAACCWGGLAVGVGAARGRAPGLFPPDAGARRSPGPREVSASLRGAENGREQGASGDRVSS